MGKYNLVASCYNSNRNCFTDEIEIKLQDGPKNELVRIDSYTTLYTKHEFLEKLRQNKIIENQDTLSIRYLKSKNSQPIYYSTIFDQPKLASSIQHLIEKKHSQNPKKIFLAVRLDDPYFQAEWVELNRLIQQNNLSQIQQKYKNQKELVFLIERYLESFYDEAAAKEQDLKEIQLEFSRYKTFRGWVASKSKRKTTPFSVKKEIVTPSPSFNSNQDFETLFQKKKLVDYKTYLLNQYNRQDMEKEEFIEEDELEQMGYLMEDENNAKRK